MRIAVLIIGLVLSIGFFIQWLIAGTVSDAVGYEAGSEAMAVGLVVSLLWIIACGVVIPLPRLAMSLFLIAGLIAYLGAATTIYADLWFWGSCALVLSLLSYFGYRGKRKADRKEAERDAMMRQVLAAQQSQLGFAAPSGARPPSACVRCGSIMEPNARFCPNCGQLQQVSA